MTRRADDGDGTFYRRALRALRRMAPKTVPHSRLDIVWAPGEGPKAHGEARSERAFAEGHMLHVVEMEDGFLEGEPAWMPKHSWSIHAGRGWKDTVAGGSAPSFEEAKARVESLLRALTGRKTN